MRIAFVTTEFVTETNFAGGLSNYTFNVAQALVAEKHEPEVFLRSDHDGLYEHYGIPLFKCSRASGFPRHIRRILQDNIDRTLRKRTRKSLLESWGVETKIRERHRTHPFDLVHYTNLGGSGVFLNKSVPSVVRLSSYRELLTPYGFLQNEGDIFGEDKSIRKAHAVISPSKYVGDFVAQKYQRNVDVVKSPFIIREINEDKAFATQSCGSQIPFGLFFGSLASWKGVYVLAHALNQFLNANPRHSFVFVGRELKSKDHEQPWKEITKIVQRNLSRIIWLDSLKHEKLFPIIRMADFVCLPSLADNLPNTLLEAMKMGKVIVASKGRSFDEVIENGKSGILCQPGCVSSLTKAMNLAANLAPSEKKRMIQELRKKLSLFDRKSVVTELLEVYRRVIDRHPYKI
jgi:glycosyltransferase involved in cell wall biosynthesis